MSSSEKYDFLIVNDMLLDEQVLRRTGEVGVAAVQNQNLELKSENKLDAHNLDFSKIVIFLQVKPGLKKFALFNGR